MATRVSVFLLTTALWVGLLTDCRAAITPVASRSALGGNDLIDWADYGTNGDLVSNPLNVTSDGGLTAAVSKYAVSGPFQLLEQSPTSWAGNFSPGDMVLWTHSFSDAAPKAITITFDSLISGIGMNIQQANTGTGVPFKAEMDAFDSANNRLGQVTVTGNSTSANDGSAVFLGLQSTSADIKTVIINVISAPFNFIGSYGINQVSLVVPASEPPPPTGAQPVPEPSSLLAGSFGIVLLGFRRFLRRVAFWRRGDVNGLAC